jgi:hypothetical protein
MEPDYNRLDPNERYRHYMAIASVSFGIISLFAALVPLCGVSVSLVGFLLGILSKKSESRKIALVGIALSILGFMISVTYQFLVFIKNS